MWIHGAEPFERYDPYSPTHRYVHYLNRPTTCAKGGGSGGGGASGKVDYPPYMKGLHGLIMAGDDQGFTIAGDVPTNSLFDALNAAYGSSPYSGAAAYDPDVPVAALLTAVCAFDTVVDALNYETDWENMVDVAVAKIDATVLPASYITAAVSAFSDNLDDRIENEVLPRFKGGMRDINGVLTSAFVIGQSHIEGMADRDVAMYQADMNFKAHSERARLIDTAVSKMGGLQMARVEGEKSVASLTTEGNRIKVIAKAQQAKDDLDIDGKDGKWDLEVFSYAGNALAAIGGGTYVPGGEEMGKSSALSGALGGAASGAMIGSAISPGIGTAIGAVVGGIGGFLM